MLFGIFGRKLGMTSFFYPTGKCIPVTAIFFTPSKVCDFKFLHRDGYDAVVLSVGHCFQNKVIKSVSGFYRNIDINGIIRKEIKVLNLNEYNVGDMFGVSTFCVGDFVTVRSVSKGKGFSGVMKRHNFSGQGASHGNSLSHRAPGSIGQCQSPGKVFKGKKMAGRMGGKNITECNLEVVLVDSRYGFLLVKGSVPGFSSCYVYVKKSI